MQPLAADDVATALAEVALGAPVNGMIEIAGPERAGLDELVGRFLGATKDPREVITDVDARYYGLVVNDQSLTPGANPRIGATFFEDWLQRAARKQETRLRPSGDVAFEVEMALISQLELIPCGKLYSLRLFIY